MTDHCDQRPVFRCSLSSSEEPLRNPVTCDASEPSDVVLMLARKMTIQTRIGRLPCVGRPDSDQAACPLCPIGLILNYRYGLRSHNICMKANFLSTASFVLLKLGNRPLLVVFMRPRHLSVDASQTKALCNIDQNLW